MKAAASRRNFASSAPEERIAAESGEQETPTPPPPRRLLDQIRDATRVRHYSIRTEAAYVDWARRFVLFHAKRHPATLGATEVSAFLTHLAVDRGVAASTQNQAKSALLFLYREVLAVELPWLDEVIVAKNGRRLPVVLTAPEVRALLHELSGTTGLVASLLYGTGMRLPPARRCATMSTQKRSSARSARPQLPPPSTSQSAATHWATLSRPIFWNPVRTSAPCRACSGTRMCRPR